MRLTTKVVSSQNGLTLEEFINKASYPLTKAQMNVIGAAGVEALRAASPKDTGMMANSWGFRAIDRIPRNGVSSIEWFNAVRVGRNQVPLAVLRQRGHATRNGSWVPGVDFINAPMARVASTADSMIAESVQSI